MLLRAIGRDALGGVVAGTALLACSAIIGTRDLDYVPDEGGTSSGDPSRDGALGDGDPSIEGGGTCGADLRSDPKHCGRCFHDCFGGACTDGTCAAVEMAAMSSAPLRSVVVSDAYVFVSGIINLSTEPGGVWRIPKGGGAPEQYVATRYAEEMAILGDRIYFVVDDLPDGGGDDGVWSCPIAGPSPCSPARLAPAENPSAITVDGDRLLYTDAAAGKGIMVVTPGGTPQVFRADIGSVSSIYADGNAFFMANTRILSSPQEALLWEVAADGQLTERYRYATEDANHGTLFGTTDALFVTAYDFAGASTAGVVRRVPRGAGGGCTYAEGKNKRPYGVFADASRVYWTNQGEGADRPWDVPWKKGSLSTCERAGCCTEPTVLWTGDEMATAVTGDETSIYFVTYGAGSVRRIAKP